MIHRFLFRSSISVKWDLRPRRMRYERAARPWMAESHFTEIEDLKRKGGTRIKAGPRNEGLVSEEPLGR
jgi:hypothetical protein